MYMDLFMILEINSKDIYLLLVRTMLLHNSSDYSLDNHN